MSGSREAAILRSGTLPNGRLLTRVDREQLLEPFLPKPRDKSSEPRLAFVTPIKSNEPHNVQQSHLSPGQVKVQRQSHGLLSWLLYFLLFHCVQLAFSLYLHTRQTYHAVFDRIFAVLRYHHRTPEIIQRDVKLLGKLPQHFSVIVELKNRSLNDEGDADAFHALVTDVAELVAWSACAKIPLISIYEASGILKLDLDMLHHNLVRHLRLYFPTTTSPLLRVRSPESAMSDWRCAARDLYTKPAQIDVLLLSASDARETIVDLSRTLTQMSQFKKISPSDVTVELIDTELTQGSCGEPDLLVIMAPAIYRAYAPYSPLAFSTRKSRQKSYYAENSSITGQPCFTPLRLGGDICLRGYPPWQVRLTEIFYSRDNSGVGYQLFLRALHRYAKAEMRLGR